MKNRITALGADRSRRTQAVALLLVAALLALAVHTFASHRAVAESAMPTNASMEEALGVRFSRVAIVADGGLVQVSYVILDSDKATRFQDDQKNLPVLKNEETGAATKRVALMKQGHSLPVGQTYYFVYNNGGTVRPNDHASLTAHGMSLPGILVE